MTAPHIVDPAGLLGEALAEASPDLMRTLLQSIINALLSADADAVVGAEYGRPTPGRTSQRNGYRHRDLDTRVGTIDVQIPKLRQGTYFPEWLLERRKRAETALITVVADCYLAGVSTRRMDKLVKTLGIHSLSKSQVSAMAADLGCSPSYLNHIERNQRPVSAQLLLRRAQRLIDKNFLELVKELAPEALAGVAKIMGVDPDTVAGGGGGY